MSTRQRHRIHPGDGDSRHGTANGYDNLGCRCGRCRAAHNTDFQRRRADRAARLALGLSSVEHGKSSTYLNWRCRCSPCTAAHTQARREWRDRARADRERAS